MYVLIGCNKDQYGNASVFLYGTYEHIWDARKEMKAEYETLLEDERTNDENVESVLLSWGATIYGKFADMHLKILDDSDRSYEF